ncbi:MAG TPA: oligosaccharide flippase family protein [Ktedonosporobacter sp.]|jgi:O-antigen/teichoic acid export membrane protein|nr:oligosaccharide flippase family protein [Ktedonosporobacter sp.]
MNMLLRSKGKIGGYTADIRELLTSSGVYALASLALPLVALVLSPFLTHTLSRTDYGILAVLTTATSLLTGITQFGLNNAFFRAYNYDYESREDKLAVLSTVIILLALSSLPLALAVVWLAPWLALLLLGNSSYSNPVRLLALIVVLQNLTVPGFSWLRAESRAVFYAALSILNLLVNLVMTVIFVGTFQLGVSGALLAVVVSYGLVVICTLPLILTRIKLRFRRDISWNLLSFGLPLVANLVSIWALQLADRFLLSRLGSLAETASYTVAYSLGGILGVLVLSPFSLAWPSTMFAIAKRDDAVALFRLVFRWYSIFLLFATFGLMLASVGALYLFFPVSYYAAMPVIPIVALSIMFFGMYNYFTVGISIRRKTWLAVLLTAMAALVNIGLNVILIPLYGSIGAAVATLAGYLLLAIGGYIVNQRLYPIPFEIGLFCLILSIGILLYGCGGLLVQMQKIDGIGALIIFIGLFCLYTGMQIYLCIHSSSTSECHVNLSEKA